MSDNLTRTTALHLGSRLERAWSKDTSADPGRWNKGKRGRAWGQCAVTALIVQDELGGELLRSTVRGVSHYWNRLPDGIEVDLTLHQFGPDARPDERPVIRSRQYVLSFPETVTRYEILRARLEGAA